MRGFLVRYNILDGMRGYFLCTMCALHLNMFLNTWVGGFSHYKLGFVEGVQGFISISGFLVGLIYGKRLLRKGRGVMVSAVLARTWRIWTHYAFALAAIGLAAAAFRWTGAPQKVLTQYDFIETPENLVAFTTLAIRGWSAPLALYVVLMLATPAILIAFRNGHAVSVAAISAVLWIGGNSGLAAAGADWLEQTSAAWGGPAQLEVVFVPTGWQVIYVATLWLGFQAAQGRLDLARLKDKRCAPLAAICFVVFIGLFLLKWGLLFGVTEWMRPHLAPSFSRDQFSGIYLLAFASDAFLAAWLLKAGPNSKSVLARAGGRLLRWVFTRRFFSFIGQHSLHVFTWHVLVVTAVQVWHDHARFSEGQATLALVLTVLSLWIPARLHAAWMARGALSAPAQAARPSAPDAARRATSTP